MRYIAIIAAEDKEIEVISSVMEDINLKYFYDIEIYIGKMNGIPCLLAKSGVGKVNSARTTQIVIDNFDVELLINTGAAGSLDDNLKVGDMVISTGLIQYDFDVTAFGREKGFVSGVCKIFEPDNNLIKICEAEMEEEKIRFSKGIVATADRFLANSEVKKQIGAEFNAICAEMEGAAVAHVCKLCNIPFVVIRSISDELNGKANIDFNEFLEEASKRCAKFIYNVVNKF